MNTKVEIIPENKEDKETIFHLNRAFSKHQIETFVNQDDAARYAEENNLEIVNFS